MKILDKIVTTTYKCEKDDGIKIIENFPDKLNFSFDIYDLWYQEIVPEIVEEESLYSNPALFCFDKTITGEFFCDKELNDGTYLLEIMNGKNLIYLNIEIEKKKEKCYWFSGYKVSEKEKQFLFFK
jgi:hypothetical protein